MSIRPMRSSRHALALIGAWCLALAACGGAADVAVPGVAGPTDDGASSGVVTTAPPFVPVPAVQIVEDALADPAAAPTTSLAAADPVVVVVPTPATSTTTPEPPPPTTVAPLTGWDAFDQRLRSILDDGSQAVSATVMRDGEVVHEVALGSRTTGEPSAGGEPVTVGDRFRIASISKVITSITVLRLVERGQVGLDDPVGARLVARVGVPTPAAGVEQITIRNLLSHRSGLAQYEDLMFDREVESCTAAALDGLTRPLERPPATTFRYSNLNFCLLGLLIEDLTGRPYADVVRDELLIPLGLDGPRLAGTFDVGEGDVEHDSDAGRNYMEVLQAAGSWIASPTDIVTIIDSLDPSTPGWKALGPAALGEMTTIVLDPPVPVAPPETTVDGAPDAAATTTTVPEPKTSGYGLGLMIFGPGSFGHTGTLESTHAMTMRRSDGITWAITVSGDQPNSSRTLATIIDEALVAGAII